MLGPSDRPGTDKPQRYGCWHTERYSKMRRYFIAFAVLCGFLMAGTVYAQWGTPPAITAVSDVANAALPKTSYDDSLFSRLGKIRPCPLPDYPDTTASALDSTTVKTVFNIDGSFGRMKQLLVYGNASTAVDSTIWGGTFIPLDDNPDSLFFYVAMADSANSSLYVEVWGPDGTVLFQSGRVTAGTGYTRKSFPFTSFATLDEHAIVYRFRLLNAGDTVLIGQSYLKRN